MIRFHFGPEDLGRTRFAISPLCEVSWSVNPILHPGRFALHRPWADAARERLRDLDWALLRELAESRGAYTPDFISPPPSIPLPDLAGELERVRATAPEQVAREVAWRFPEGPPALVRPLLDDPERGIGALVELMAAYWHRAIEPWWPELLAVLEADVVHRARSLAAGGALEVFADLHPKVRWDGARNVLEVDRRHDEDVELGGRGLLLVPAAFAWPDVFAMHDPPWQPSLIYTPRGIGALWAPSDGGAQAALDALIGRRRAAILRALAVPSSTTELARRLGASPAGVSEHLSVLRAAGLAAPERAGRVVRYARTARGEALVGR